jgi:phage tail-like protein
MAPRAPADIEPLLPWRFLVEVEGQSVERVVAVGGLTRSTEPVTVRAGGARGPAQLVPGLTRFEPVRIDRILDPRDTLFDDWVRQVDQGAGFRRNVVVTLLDAARNPAKSWRLLRCWPSGHVAFSQLDGLGNAVVIEALTLAVEAWEPRT